MFVDLGVNCSDMNDTDQRDAVNIDKVFQLIHLVGAANKKAAARALAAGGGNGRITSPTTSPAGSPQRQQQEDNLASEAYGLSSASATLNVPVDRHVVQTFFTDVATAGSPENITSFSSRGPLTKEEQATLTQLADSLDYVLPLPMVCVYLTTRRTARMSWALDRSATVMCGVAVHAHRRALLGALY